MVKGNMLWGKKEKCAGGAGRAVAGGPDRRDRQEQDGRCASSLSNTRRQRGSFSP